MGSHHKNYLTNLSNIYVVTTFKYSFVINKSSQDYKKTKKNGIETDY